MNPQYEILAKCLLPTHMLECFELTNVEVKPKENNTEAYIRHVSDYTGISPNKVLGSPQEHPTQWLLIGYAMAVVECGKALPAVPMIKGFALAMDN